MLATQEYRASLSAFVVFAIIFGVPGALLAWGASGQTPEFATRSYTACRV
jgi:hypothetical protein